MSRFQKIVFLGFIIAVGALVYMEATKPQPINWLKSYSSEDKIPFGTFVLHDLLAESLEESISQIHQPPYEKLLDTTFRGTYLFINDYVNFDRIELEKLTEWVKGGNTVFISANSHSEDLLDSLQIEMQTAVQLNSFESKPLLDLINENLKSTQPYLMDRNTTVRYFNEIDTVSQTVLGVTQLHRDTLQITNPKVNFIQAPLGDGIFYLHNQPEIFSNYFLLKESNYLHTQNVLSYIHTPGPLYWDQYHISGKKVNVSGLYILLNNRYFKWAYYFMLLGVALFVFFEGKRKQRSIPIVKPPSNKTFEYTRTISGMYLNKKDYTSIARKQMALFLEYVRTQLRVSTEKREEHFLEMVASRSGNDMESTRELFKLLNILQQRESISMAELIKLNRLITDYKNKTHGSS